MRIALVTENFLPKIDGVTRTLGMVLTHLRATGHHALVLGPTGAPRHYAGARVLAAPGIPIPFYPELRLLLPPPAFRRAIERFRPDVVHVVDPMMLGAAGVVWSRRLGIPVVSSYHTNLAAYCRSFHLAALEQPTWNYRRALHNAAAITLCPSPSTATALAARGFEHLAVWPRGVDTAQFTPDRRDEAWRRGILRDPTRVMVLYVGRLSHEKNLVALMDAFRALPPKSDAHLVLVGDGPARADLERTLADANVTFTGYLRGDALARAYASADIFAFPSQTETFGQVVLEAMASGLPVVGFAAEGVRDLVVDGETGVLVSPLDRGGFSQALALLVGSKSLRERLGAGAVTRARRYRWEDALETLIEHYLRTARPRVAAA